MKLRLFSTTLMVFALTTSVAKAHFLWLLTQPEEHASKVQLFFSEGAAPDDPDLLDRVAKAQVWAVSDGRGGPEQIEMTKQDDALQGEIPQGRQGSAIVVKHTYGVLEKGGSEPFLLMYYGKTYPSVLPGTWKEVDDNERLPLEIIPTLNGSKLTLTVHKAGEPLAESEVVIEGPGFERAVDGKTDSDGSFSVELSSEGLFSIRAKHVEKAAGEHEGKKYGEVRHYTTLSLRAAPEAITTANHHWPVLPQGVTSFGGAIDGNWLYVYGGHYGQAHHYSREGQSGDFRRLNLHNPQAWETLRGGPKRTGLAMVAHGGKIYRIGGFAAENGDDEAQNLQSTTDFARFDPETREWEDLPELPAGRSSHDAAVVGDTIYVVGGWKLAGDAESVWHDTALAVDLSHENLEWKTIPNPPFQRRAVALAAFNGKLYCLGGMQSEGGPTTKTAIYDPAAQAWSEGPRLLGGAMDGFGASAFAADDALYTTTMSGSIQRLSSDGDRWTFVGQLKSPRFFHRLLPLSEGNSLVAVGGASMLTGKMDDLEKIVVRPTP